MDSRQQQQQQQQHQTASQTQQTRVDKSTTDRSRHDNTAQTGEDRSSAVVVVDDSTQTTFEPVVTTEASVNLSTMDNQAEAVTRNDKQNDGAATHGHMHRGNVRKSFNHS